MSDAKTSVNKPEEKKPADVNDIAAIVAKTVEALLPALMVASKPQPVQYVSDAKLPKARCPVCGQVQTGCESKHVEMVVYPVRRPEYADCFQGAFINGVKYLSDGPSSKILVPESAQSTIQVIIDNYEENEVQTRNGRSKQKNRPGPVQPAVDGWR